jgi:CII-binding regulator of phage lambda lysogenization HflD
MNVKVNLNQILQGGLAGLVAWLFKTVNDLQQQVARLEVSVINAESKLADVLSIISGIDDSITEIIWKIGG